MFCRDISGIRILTLWERQELWRRNPFIGDDISINNITLVTSTMPRHNILAAPHQVPVPKLPEIQEEVWAYLGFPKTPPPTPTPAATPVSVEAPLSDTGILAAAAAGAKRSSHSSSALSEVVTRRSKRKNVDDPAPPPTVRKKSRRTK